MKTLFGLLCVVLMLASCGEGVPNNEGISMSDVDMPDVSTLEVGIPDGGMPAVGMPDADSGTAHEDEPDTPEEDEDCHIDCFGYSSCTDGIATTWAHTPVPCKYWTGSCPIDEEHTCEQGCGVASVDVSSIPASALCAENLPSVDDPCEGDEDCRLPWYSQEWMPAETLVCEPERSVCVEFQQ